MYLFPQKVILNICKGKSVDCNSYKFIDQKVDWLRSKRRCSGFSYGRKDLIIELVFHRFVGKIWTFPLKSRDADPIGKTTELLWSTNLLKVKATPKNFLGYCLFKFKTLTWQILSILIVIPTYSLISWVPNFRLVSSLLLAPFFYLHHDSLKVLNVYFLKGVTQFTYR